MYKTALLVLSFLVKWVNTCKDLQRETQSKLSVNDACNYAMTPQDRPGWKCRSYQKAYFHSLRTSNNQNCCLHWMWGLWGEELLVIRPSNRLDSVDRTSGPAKSLHTISFKVPFNSKILGVYRKSLSLPFLLELIIFFPFIQAVQEMKHQRGSILCREGLQTLLGPLQSLWAPLLSHWDRQTVPHPSEYGW